MRRMLMFAISLVCILAFHLCFVTVDVSEAQVAMNAPGDLLGENMGDHIAFNWAYQDGTANYIIYRSTSINGPWEEIDRMDDDSARSGGANLDVTPLARQMDLCYKVEAVDAGDNVIRRYKPMCIPKFAGK